MKYRKKSAAVAAFTAAAVVASSPGAWAAEVKGSLVKATKTSEWSTPSPDPSGIGYNESTKRFLITDGEVEEDNMAWLYKGVNVFETETSGELKGTAVTVPWSKEPTGIAVNLISKEIYVSDDDQRSVFVLDSLSDTDPGVIGKSKFTAHGVDPDLEGVAYDSKNNEILVANGERGAGFWRVKPGEDGHFGTDDDVVDPKILVPDAVDPEGIAYDSLRQTIVMVDGSADKIFEMNAAGAILNKIDISGMGMKAAAGIEVAPASNGSSTRNYFIVDRGVDNDSDPNENDGVLFEVSAKLDDADANQPPTANAGSDQVTTVGGTVTLAGSGTDIEPGQLTYGWKQQSGPAGVSFGTSNADTANTATTTATFTEAGTYVLRLTVTDADGLSSSDDVTVTVGHEGEVLTVTRPALASDDDAMEGTSTGGKYVDVTSKQNALGMRQPSTGAPYQVLTGMRFPNIPVPKGGRITSAKIQFKVDEVTTGAASLTFKGEAADDAAPFGGSGNISGRIPTTASVPWSPPDWITVNSTGPEALSPDLKSILQEIVDRPGWAARNTVALTVSGSGRRAAKAVDAGAAHAPVLKIQYTTEVTPPPPDDSTPPPSGGGGGGGSTPPPSNTAPTVSAGSDATVPVTGPAALDGTVTDDGLPSGTLSVAWTKVSGPGEVTFADAKQVDTGATFSAAGSYTLRLTASDGALSTSDDVVITVQDSGASGATEVTLDSERRAVRHSGTVRLDGTVAAAGKAASGATVEVYVSRAGGRFRLLASRTAGDDGAFSFEDRPDVNSVYVAFSDGSSSATVRVLVRPRMRAHLRHSIVKAGTRTAIVGRVSPAADGHLLRLQKRAGDTWRTVRTLSIADGGDRARFRFVVRPRFSRAHWYRVVSPPQAGRARAVVGGRQLRLRAYEATVKRVNHRADVVVVRNTGRVPFSLERWTLVERWSGRRIGLPEFLVRRGRVVRIHTGEGTDDGRNLHLGAGEMWAAHGVAELRDARLRLADRLRY
jgi:hypothetical protein